MKHLHHRTFIYKHFPLNLWRFTVDSSLPWFLHSNVCHVTRPHYCVFEKRKPTPMVKSTFSDVPVPRWTILGRHMLINRWVFVSLHCCKCSSVTPSTIKFGCLFKQPHISGQSARYTSVIDVTLSNLCCSIVWSQQVRFPFFLLVASLAVSLIQIFPILWCYHLGSLS